MKEKDQCKYFPWYCDFCDKRKECNLCFVLYDYIKSREEKDKDLMRRQIMECLILV